jgi:formylglycine-generating enzyme required for sulfatase activity
MNRRRIQMLGLLVIASTLLAACAARGTTATPLSTGAATRAPTVPEAKTSTTLPEPTQAQVLPTDTPLPSPPTRTPLPTPTAPPTSTPAPTPADQAAETPTPLPTVPPSPQVTDVMIEIPAGAFVMGSDAGDPEDAPAHQVDLAAFEIDKYEVTNADFDLFVQATDYVTDAEQGGKKSWRDSFAEGKEDHPVVRVTWNDAVAYCAWRDKRLPSEAEWEKAARGTQGYRYPWGDEWDAAKANARASGLRGTVAVGSFGAGASPYGVEDLAGNVWEWTADWYQAYPGNAVGDAYYGEICRVTRGGGWFDQEPQLTTFNRNCADPAKTAIDELGFRCAR